jgi:hypothetical protein
MASAGRQKPTSSLSSQMFLTASAIEAFMTANMRAARSRRMGRVRRYSTRARCWETAEFT